MVPLEISSGFSFQGRVSVDAVVICKRRLHRQGDADDAGMAGLRRDNFQSAVMGFNDFPADGQAKAQADIARGEKGRGNAFCGLGSEAGAVVLHFNLEILAAALVPARSAGGHPPSVSSGFACRALSMISDKRVFERGAVAGEADGLARWSYCNCAASAD